MGADAAKVGRPEDLIRLLTRLTLVVQGKNLGDAGLTMRRSPNINN
jgi:hypothetical protein